MNGNGTAKASEKRAADTSEDNGGYHPSNEQVDVKGGPPAGTFSWSAAVCRVIVLIVWGITPLSWLYVLWSASCVFSVSTSSSAACSRRLPPWIHVPLLLYTTIEAGFSIYYKYLVHLAQVQPPLPAYGRAFLRQTLARALENGMKLEDEHSITNNPQQLFPDTSTGMTGRTRRPTFSRANFSQLSFLDKARPLPQNDPRAVDWRDMFSKWFLGAQWDELKQDNVLEWLAWSFYAVPLEVILHEWEQEGRPPLPETLQDADEVMRETPADDEASRKLGFLYQGLYMLEARAGMPLPEGRTEGVNSIRLHLDPVKATSRPLAKYLVTGFFNILLYRRVRKAGFCLEKHGGLEYLIRMPHDWTPGNEETSPTMFIHGLGMGLAQYASLVSYFEQHPTLKRRPLILLVQPHLSMSLFHPQHRRPPSKESTTRGFRELVQRWGFQDGITIVSHSNGTIVAGWILKECTELIKRSCFIDPVTFCLWEPHIAYNFLYRPPKTGIDVLMRYFVGEELGIALMLQRYFDWSANILWFEEIPQALDPYRTAFFLAEKDSILNASRTARYLCDHGVKHVKEGGNLRLLRGMAHGEALITGGKGLVQVMDWLTWGRQN